MINENTFAAACYNDNTIEDLENALRGEADLTDCETWKLTPAEWREQIELALAHLRYYS